MVFFTCNACGESLKKNQVEKHLNSCRNCRCLSCIDCGKDFCLQPRVRYFCRFCPGLMAMPLSITDVDSSQYLAWSLRWRAVSILFCLLLQKIHEAMNKPGIAPKVCGILKEVSLYDNVPRKKAKFQNWMKNSLKVFNTALHDQVWEIFSAATSNVNTPVTENETSAKEKKKNKRERKEERQKKSKKEKKQLKLESQEEDGENSKTKKHKDDHGDMEEEAENGERKKKKKNKKKAASVEVMRENGTGNDNRHEAMTSSKKRKHESSEGKFSWKGTIQAVLKQSPEGEISVKKLRKKVLAEYYSVNGEDNHKSEEKLLSLFNKKISSNPKFRVLKDKVKLVK
ncbi:LYAR protein, partial [Polyodon spathula]|nr:LYAR protein [Polyodon spathula]